MIFFGVWWWGQLDRNASWFTSEAPRVVGTEELLHYVSQPAHPPGVGGWLREETESTGWISDVGKETWFILDLSWFITSGYVPQHGNILLFPSWHSLAWQPQLLLIQSPFSAVNFQFTHVFLGEALV